MKRFPFKILFLSIFMPPICYVLTLQMLEGYFQKREIDNLNHILVQNVEALYEGRYTIGEEINNNIREYLSHSLKYKLGVRTHILVKTKDDRILYPARYERSFKDTSKQGDFSEPPLNGLNYMEVAAENFRIMNEGLTLSVVVQIRHNTWLSNSILIFYVILFVLILQRFIKKGMRETEREQSERERRIELLSDKVNQADSELKAVRAKESHYLDRIAEFRQSKQELSKDIDGLLEEMERLEEGLEDQKDLRQEKEFEVLQLREELDRLKGRLDKPRKKKKRVGIVMKRFRVLYKNLAFADRAIEGYVSLPDEFQLKAEEVIHRLNEDDSLVPVKRKVFGKGGKKNVLEVDFSYSGRIYFKKDSQAKTKILVIGTKNTQEQDLAFIENIK